MSDEAALLRAICADPDEDTPRLAFADYLDENGNADRAAFIRGQVELATLADDSLHRREVAFRCRQLLDANEDEWLDPREAFERDWGWSRGFVETFSTTPGDLSYAHDGLFHKYPFRRLWLWELEGNVDGVSLIPDDNRLTALDLIGNNLNVSQLKKFARMTHLPHLRELGLMFNDLRDTAVEVLCGESFFQHLKLIRLGANPFTARGRDQLGAHFGRRVTFAHEREPDRLYTMQDDRFRIGWGDDCTQLLAYRRFTAVFDHAGNLLPVAWPDPSEFDYRSGTIKVKRFELSDGSGIHPFNWWAEAFDTQTPAERPGLEALVARWLESGQYRFGRSGEEFDLWFDRTGEVTDT